ncbi:TRAP transporter small permease [Microvirga sp. Marseille-Q2068]|uniref:TRAP transporter small permease protein n=2 Tax=Microvirga mediterraneensis TaxID=2754695 RepID=A0A838BJ92_9HYPH|nr:TRAP transporter small permease [Microvirga mediterraneensis]
MVRLAERLPQMLAWVAGLVILLMMIHVMIDVLGKYLFNAPLPGTAEVVAAYYMIGAVFLPIAYVEAAGGSIVVEVIYEKVPERAQKLMLVTADLISAIYYSVLAWFSWDLAVRAWRVNETVDGIWRITTWPAKFLLPFGFCLAVVVLLMRVVRGEHGREADPNSTVEI